MEINILVTGLTDGEGFAVRESHAVQPTTGETVEHLVRRSLGSLVTNFLKGKPGDRPSDWKPNSDL